MAQEQQVRRLQHILRTVQPVNERQLIPEPTKGIVKSDDDVVIIR